MRGQFRRWVFRIFAVTLGLLLCAIIAGSIYQAIESTRERRLYPPPGELIDVGGYHLHLTCAGTGSPTVVLQWSYSLTWYLVQPEIARFTRVCAVDPAGIGWSDSGPRPRDSDQIAKELNLLLSRANVPPPYILVGHSRGAFYIRVYAARFHNSVAGAVFVDPEDENTSKRIPELNPSAVVRAGLRIGPLLTNWDGTTRRFVWSTHMVGRHGSGGAAKNRQNERGCRMPTKCCSGRSRISMGAAG